MTGEPVYSARFLKVFAYHLPPGLAPAQFNNEHSGWAHIRLDGSAAYPQRYAHTFGFYEGQAAVQDASHDEWYHIEPSERRLYAHQAWVWAGNFQGRLCTVRLPCGEYGHIDSAGELRTGGPYTYAGDFREGYAAVRTKTDGLYRHVDPTAGSPQAYLT